MPDLPGKDGERVQPSKSVGVRLFGLPRGANCQKHGMGRGETEEGHAVTLVNLDARGACFARIASAARGACFVIYRRRRAGGVRLAPLVGLNV